MGLNGGYPGRANGTKKGEGEINAQSREKAEPSEGRRNGSRATKTNHHASMASMTFRTSSYPASRRNRQGGYGSVAKIQKVVQANYDGKGGQTAKNTSKGLSKKKQKGLGKCQSRAIWGVPEWTKSLRLIHGKQ